MEKLVILLITAGVGLTTTERSSKQLFFARMNPYTTTTGGVNTIIPNNKPIVLYTQHGSSSNGDSSHLIPYSNVYPYYNIWNNFGSSIRNPAWTLGNVNVLNDQQNSNAISQGTPVVSQEVNPVRSSAHSPNSLSPSNSYFRVPLSPAYAYYPHQYLWNSGSSSQSVSNQLNSNDELGTGVPLKSYEDIRKDANIDSIIIKPYLSSEGEYQNDQSFQRGQVESFPSNGNSHHYASPENQQNKDSFTRGHVESTPVGFSDVGANSRNSQDKVGFIRGAVEHSNYQGTTQGAGYLSLKQTRYDASSASAKVVCYFHSWSNYRTDKGKFSPENADPKLCTHVIYSFANLDKSKFAIKESDPKLDKEMGFYERTVALKQRNPDLKVLLGLGGWSDSGDDKYSTLAHSSEGRRKFARDAVAFLKKYKFDGLSLDWHYPKCWQSDCEKGPATDRQAYSDLLQEVKSVFQPEGLVLSISISGYKEVIDKAYDVPAISRTADFINVMTFDYHGHWDKKTGHLAPLFQGPIAFDPNPTFNANYTLEYLVWKGAERSKLILGAPMYGQSFQLSNPGDSGYGSESVGPGEPGKYTKQPGMLAYYEICSNLKDRGWTSKMDLTRSWGPYAYKGSQWVGYDDMEFLTRKARFVKQQQFGGMFVWTIDLDDFNNLCCKGSLPLLRTIAREILGIPYEPKNDCSVPITPPTPPTTPGGATSKPVTEHTFPTNTWWPSTTPTTTQPVSTSQQPEEGSTDVTSTTQESSSYTPTTPIITTPTTTTTPPDTQDVHPSLQLNSTVIFICQQANDSILHSKPQETVKPPLESPSPPVESGVPVETGTTCDSSWTFKGDPDDCTSYFQCVAGTVAKKRCPSGLHWSSISNICDWPQYANCPGTTTTTTITPWTEPPTPTQPPTTTTQRPTTTTQRPTPPPPPAGGCRAGEYSPGPTCDRYYLCNDGMQQIQSCGPGLHWNKEKKLCDWPQSANCQGSTSQKNRPGGIRDPSTTPCQTGEYSGSNEDCEVYYLCNHGILLEFRCTGGLHWNNQAKLCDWPANAGCSVSQPVPGPPPPAPTTTTTPRTTTTTTPYTTTTQKVTSTTTKQTSSYPPPTPRPTTTVTTTSNPAYISSSLKPSPDTESPSDFMIVCYFTNWAWYRPDQGKYKPDSIDPSLCTHIVYGFAVLDANELVIKAHDTWADFENHFYEQVTAFKTRGAKVTLALGGWNDSAGDKYSRLVSSVAARRKFVTSVIEFLKKNNFDGLDLDWEYPVCWQVECSKGPPSDKENFGALVRELKEAFIPHGLLLSAAVSPSKTVIDAAYDVPGIGKYLDWIAVMTYDFHGQWDKKTGHVAPLYFHEEDDFYYFNANYSVNYWVEKGAERKKIVMGMPLYGQSFTLADERDHGLNAKSTGGGTPGEYTRAGGFLAYYEICTRVMKDGWTVVKDESGAMGPYAYKGNQWVSYDDKEMIRKKAELIRELGIGGGMVWALDLDDFGNVCGEGKYPLLGTIKEVLGRKGSSGGGGIGQILSKTTVKPEMIMSTTTYRPVETTRLTTTMTQMTQEYTTKATTTSTRRPGGLKEGDCNSEPFRPHESDCNKYYLCLFGNYIEQNCAPGTYWNKDRCDWVCGGTSSGGGAGTTTQRPRPTMGPTTTQSWKPSTTQQQTQWTSHTTTTMSSWTPTSTQPSTSTSWEWKPPIITTTTINPVEVPPSEFKVVCYFTNWAWYRQGIGKYKPEDIDYNLCTHIAYGFAVLNGETLQIKTHDSWADVDNSFYKLVTDIKSKGKKVVIAIGGWNDSLGDKYSRLVRDAGARRRFIQNVIEFIKKYNFDGLDLDWEYPKCWQTDCKLGPASDRANFATFVRELKEAFAPYGYLLSSAVSPSKMIIDEGYDVPIINKYLDWIAVMTYDYHGQWDKKTGHVAPLYNHEESDNFYFNSNYTMNYWMEKGADRKKLVMGMPMYGQSFTLSQSSNHGLNAPSSGGGTAGEFTRASGFLAYYEICQNIKKGWTVVKDETGAIGPYAYKGDQWVSYDDIEMIRRKSQYIKDMGFGGGMIWALDLDDFRNVCGCEKHPLLKTINRVLRNYPEPDPQCKM